MTTVTSPPTSPAAARRRMLTALQPLLGGQGWSAAFTAVRRDLLGTAFYRPGEFRPVTGTDPGFADMIYDPQQALILQPGQLPRLHAPSPAFCARLLTGLAVSRRHHVYVIGARDPYPTALLCQHLGDDHVTAVEPHPYHLARARTGLAAAGYHPRLRSSAETPDGPAPTHLLCAHPIKRIPVAWLHLLGPRGVIVAALSSQRTGDTAARLVVRRNGTAAGPFLPGAPPALPPAAHADAPATRTGLTVSAAAGHTFACLRLWRPPPADDLGPC